MKNFSLAAGTLVLLASSVFASTDYKFLCVSAFGGDNNSGICTTLANQFNVNVNSNAAGTVDFKFTNAVGIQSSISEIYFDFDSSLMNTASIFSQVGTDFTLGANPPNLPGGNNPNILFSADEAVDAVGNPSKGIDTAADSTTIRFNLGAGKTLADINSALAAGTFRMGLHVRAIGCPAGVTGCKKGESDSFVTTGVVPEPTTYAALAAAVAGTLAIARRRRSMVK
jgi:hypothetical protein